MVEACREIREAPPDDIPDTKLAVGLMHRGELRTDGFFESGCFVTRVNLFSTLPALLGEISCAALGTLATGLGGAIVIRIPAVEVWQDMSVLAKIYGTQSARLAWIFRQYVRSDMVIIGVNIVWHTVAIAARSADSAK